MSLIYRSLEQLRRQKAAAEPGGLPPAAAAKPKPSGRRRMRRLVLIAAGLFVLMGVGMMGVAWYLDGELGRLPGAPGAPAPREVARSGAPGPEEIKARAQERRKAEEAAQRKAEEEAKKAAEAQALAEAQAKALAELEAKSKAKEADVARRAAEQKALEDTARLAAMDAPPPPGRMQEGAALSAPQDAASATPASAQERERMLAQHFTSQAQRNMRIRTLERTLTAAAKTGDVGGMQKDVEELAAIVGAESVSVIKWQGFLAMKQDRWSTAVAQLSRALALAPGDVETRYNLVLALTRTERVDEARKIFRPLLEDHGEDQRIRALGAYLTTLHQR
ncbi:MAG: tetratricopeptide repeat protein [Desulfovibrionaceae bacterium]|jgi:hypothetical protein|nr:tetratricopeptide repeat protein [Desulfovibrionaceae bacterium]